MDSNKPLSRSFVNSRSTVRIPSSAPSFTPHIRIYNSGAVIRTAFFSPVYRNRCGIILPSWSCQRRAGTAAGARPLYRAGCVPARRDCDPGLAGGLRRRRDGGLGRRTSQPDVTWVSHRTGRTSPLVFAGYWKCCFAPHPGSPRSRPAATRVGPPSTVGRGGPSAAADRPARPADRAAAATRGRPQRWALRYSASPAPPAPARRARAAPRG
jgi:hypothetical protein